MFRHGSDENGVGWSDIETPAGNASPDGIEAESGIAACPTDPSGAKKESIEEAANQGVPAQLFVEISSVQQALIAACGARVLLICDAEGAEAGQAGNLIGDSLDAQEYLGALRGGSSRRGR